MVCLFFFFFSPVKNTESHVEVLLVWLFLSNLKVPPFTRRKKDYEIFSSYIFSYLLLNMLVNLNGLI